MLIQLKLWTREELLVKQYLDDKICVFESAWHDPQHHPQHFFQTHADFGTKS